MKKLLKISLLSLSILSVSPILASCFSNTNNQNSLNSLEIEKFLKKEPKLNLVLKDFSNKYFFNKNELESTKENFYLEQKNIGDSIFDELNVSLTFAPPFVVDAENKSDSYKQKSVVSSIEIINSTLTNNWFWYLNNFTKFTYLFNNWDSSYKDKSKAKSNSDNDDIRNSFIKTLEDKKTLIQEFRNYQITNFTKAYDIYKNQEDENEIKILFFIIEDINNKGLIPIFIYKNESEKNYKVLITADVFVFDKNNFNSESETEKIAKLISDARKHYIDNDLEYFKKISDNGEFNDKEQKEVLSRWSDKHFLSLYSKYSYFDTFYKAINDYNKSNNNNILRRYTWGYINEN